MPDQKLTFSTWWTTVPDQKLTCSKIHSILSGRKLSFSTQSINNQLNTYCNLFFPKISHWRPFWKIWFQCFCQKAEAVNNYLIHSSTILISDFHTAKQIQRQKKKLTRLIIIFHVLRLFAYILAKLEKSKMGKIVDPALKSISGSLFTWIKKIILFDENKNGL